MDNSNTTTQAVTQTPWPSALLPIFFDAGSGPREQTWTWWKQLLLPTLIAYVALCRVLRHRRERAMLRAFGYPLDGESKEGRAALARMTNHEAQRIIHYISGYEIPRFHVVSLQFALFKVGWVPLFLA